MLYDIINNVEVACLLRIGDYHRWLFLIDFSIKISLCELLYRIIAKVGKGLTWSAVKLFFFLCNQLVLQKLCYSKYFCEVVK